jgi:hypothetical protein
MRFAPTSAVSDNAAILGDVEPLEAITPLPLDDPPFTPVPLMDSPSTPELSGPDVGSRAYTPAKKPLTLLVRPKTPFDVSLMP